MLKKITPFFSIEAILEQRQFFSYQNEATEHNSEENEPLKVLVFHQTSDAAPEL